MENEKKEIVKSADEITSEISAKLKRIGDAFLKSLNSVPKDEQY